MSDDPRLYHELAYLWPIFSAPKEYAGEAICWREVLQNKLGPGTHHTLVALDAGILSVPTTTAARIAWADLPIESLPGNI